MANRKHKRSPKNGISKARVKAAERHAEALELRKAGLTYKVIAEQLGYKAPVGAHKAVAAGLKATLQEPADAVRQLELSRLDRMLAAAWPKVLKGDVKAGGYALRIMERRAVYLGLDAPVKIDLEAHIRRVAEEEGLDPDEAVTIADDIIRENRW